MPTILIADQGGLFRALETSPSLRSACKLVSVKSSSDLLSIASTDTPDLFLLDADQFGSSAVDCIRRIKADRTLAAVPIIMAAREGSAIQGLLGERDRLFTKPVRPDEVGAVLQGVLPLARRAGRRVPLSVPVVCTLDDRETVRARTKDLASGGIFLKTPWEPERGTKFRATFVLPAPSRRTAEDVEISAMFEVVRRVGPDEPDLIAGVGATIVEISETDAGWLRKFVGAGAGAER